MQQHREDTQNFSLLSGTNPFPVSEYSLCRYSAYLASENLKASSIKGYLSVCRQLQITLGLGDPFEKPLPLLEYVLKGIKSDQAKKMPAGRSRLPITPDILQRIWKVWNRDPGNPDLIMLWAACTTCFTGFLQSGEIVVPSAKEFDPGVHLSFGDVSPDNPEDPQVVQINIKASNTDLFRKGISVFSGGQTHHYAQWLQWQHIWQVEKQTLGRSSSSGMGSHYPDKNLLQK